MGLVQERDSQFYQLGLRAEVSSMSLRGGIIAGKLVKIVHVPARERDCLITASLCYLISENPDWTGQKMVTRQAG